MSIASELTALAANLASANAAITEAGGTASTTGMSGLPAAIGSIAGGGGGDTEYGKVYYYSSWTTGYYSDYSGTDITDISVSQNTFENYLINKGVYSPSSSASISISIYQPDESSPYTYEFNYDDWGSSDPMGMTSFQDSWTTQEAMTAATGVSFTLVGTASSYYFSLRYGTTVDTTSQVTSGVLLSAAEYGSLAGSDSGAITTIHEQSVPKKAIKEFEGGTATTAVPDYFLAQSPALTRVVLPPNTTTIGTYVCSYCDALVTTPSLPSSVTSIGSNFLFHCDIVDGDITIPSGVTSTPSSFLANCPAFSSSVNFADASAITSVGGGLLTGTAFNQALSFPNATSVGAYVLQNCGSFNSSISLPKAQTIGAGFLTGCSSFNQPLSLPEVTSIGNDFLTGCSAFNQPLSFPTGLTSIGDNFLLRCTSFNSALTLPEGLLTIGKYFLAGSTMNTYTQGGVFNQPLSLPQTLTRIGNTSSSYDAGFFKAQDNMTSAINVGALDASVVSSNAANYTTTFTVQSSSAPSYVQGIPIKGSARATWLTKFPVNTANRYYRKLTDGGE